MNNTGSGENTTAPLQPQAPPLEGDRAPQPDTTPVANQGSLIKEPTAHHTVFAPQPPSGNNESVAECNSVQAELGRLLKEGRRPLLALVGTAEALFTHLHTCKERR